MKILITGGAGFIGTNLTKRLLNDNNKVICIDNLYSGSYDNIKQFLDNKNYEFINHDVRDSYDIECEQIYNLACPASPKFYQKDPIFTLETCFKGMQNALNNASRYNASVLQASTSEVYGNPLVHPQNEEYFGNVNTYGIRSCYDEGKRITETLCREFQNTHIIRIFNTYGPYMRKDDGRVISNFINQALCGDDITIYGSGNQTRSFQYIDDLLDAMIMIMNSDIHQPINIGNPEEYTMNDLIQQKLYYH